MEAGDLPHTVHPEFTPQRPHRPVKRWSGMFLGVAWITGMILLATVFSGVAKYFDATERLNSLVAQKRALLLKQWTLEAYRCPSFYAEFSSCQRVQIETESGKAAEKLNVQIPLKQETIELIEKMIERPNVLLLNYALSESEKLWLSGRTTAANSSWPTQAQLVALGSFECEARNPNGEDFDHTLEPEKLTCHTQTRFDPIKEIPSDNHLSYYINLGAQRRDIGPQRWPMILGENQHLHEILSLDQLSSSATVLWNLISLLMPIFVIAFRFVFKNEKMLNTLSDYAVAMVIYALCIITLDQSSFVSPSIKSSLSTICILLEGVILTLLARYAYCISSGRSWSMHATALLSTMSAIVFIALFAVSKNTPQTFLLKSHFWRDALASFVGIAALLMGAYNRAGFSRGSGSAGTSNFTRASDDFGSVSYFIRFGLVGISLVIFGMSNLRELTNPSLKILKWEELQFLPSQTAIIAFFLGMRTSSTLRYGQSMKERLESLFSGVLQLQRALTPLEAVDAAVKGIRETLHSTAESSVELIEHRKWATDQIQMHISLSHQTLYIPLHGRTSYKGLLRFERVKQEYLSEEEEYILSTMASALAINLENQEAASELEKMHQASLRFVPHDFLRLLKQESLVDFNLGDNIELRMTVMFADIRNFTQISEGMTPAQNFEFINGFLTHIAPVIKHHGGFIDKYIGDAIMALFPDSPVNALRCAIDMQIALRTFNDRWLGLINQEIRVGVGIHHGPMILGIVGYAERLSGTVMADAVNLASRLESLTKKYPANIIVSEDVLQHMSPTESKEFNLNMLDSVRVKGRNAMVTIYDVVVPNEQEQSKAS